MKKNSYLTVTDQFCGAGGSSQGVRRLAQKVGGGIEVKMALNHWKLAIETHNTNFPDTLHDCTDISAADPRRYPSTDILITSPECTTHSPAGGNNHKSLRKQLDLFDTGAIDPATERSRATMWDVCRFAEYHKYRCIIVENVVEAKTRWALFDTWLTAMHVLGYNHRLVFHNSMHHHPTPQSRDRMYVVFWQKGNRAPMLDHTPTAYCAKCQKDILSVQTWKNKLRTWGKYRQQYVYCCPACRTIVEPYYYASFNCIDWRDLGQRIGDRKKPLADKTMARIQFGLDKYGKQPLQVVNYSPGYCKTLSDPTGAQRTTDSHALLTPQPLLINTAYGSEARGVSRSGMEPGFTQTTVSGQAVVTPQPFLVDVKQTSGVSFRVRSATQPTCTMHTGPSVGLLTPFLIDSAYGGVARPVDTAKRTQTTQHTEGLVSVPLITELRGTSKARPATRELNGVTAGGINSGILTDESWKSFIASYYGTDNLSGIDAAIGTVTCKDRHGLISYQKPKIEDCYYRMLFPHEIKGAMAFDQEYVVLGSGKDQVKQLGNAVTPPAMEWLVERCVESLA